MDCFYTSALNEDVANGSMKVSDNRASMNVIDCYDDSNNHSFSFPRIGEAFVSKDTARMKLIDPGTVRVSLR